MPGNAPGQFGIVENRGKIDAPRLPVIDRRLHIEHVDAANHFIDGAETQIRHVLPHLFGDIEEEIDHVLGLALELLAQFGILRGNADRTGVEVALAQHDAAQGDQGRGGEAEFFRAQKRGDHDIAPGLQLAVSLHADAAAQVVHQQNLLGFRQAEFPGNAGMLDRTPGRCAGTAAVAADEHNIGVRLGHAGGHRAHSDLGHQLYRDPGLGVDVLQVIDQLGQIFDRIDVVMRRRRNQSHAGNGMPQTRDHVIHLVAGKLTAFPGFRALRHLDLQLRCVDQVIRSHAEARRGYLLDRAAPPVSVGVPLVTLFVFATLAGIRHSADPVHGDSQSLVRLLADRAERHGPGGKALHDLFGRLHFLDGNGLFGLLDLHQAAQRRHVLALLVNQFGVLLESGKARLPHRMLQLADGQRIQQVIFAVDAVVIASSDRKFGIGFGKREEGKLMLHLGFARQHTQADSLQTRSRAREIGIHQFFAETNRLKHLRPAIALQRGDPHLGESLQQSFIDGLDEVLDRDFGVQAFGQIAPPAQVFQGLNRQIRIHRARSVADQEREVHDLARLARLDDERHLGASLLPH